MDTPSRTTQGTQTHGRTDRALPVGTTPNDTLVASTREATSPRRPVNLVMGARASSKSHESESCALPCIVSEQPNANVSQFGDNLRPELKNHENVSSPPSVPLISIPPLPLPESAPDDLAVDEDFMFELNISNLMKLGYDFNSAKIALVATGNFDNALDLLLEDKEIAVRCEQDKVRQAMERWICENQTLPQDRKEPNLAWGPQPSDESFMLRRRVHEELIKAHRKKENLENVQLQKKSKSDNDSTKLSRLGASVAPGEYRSLVYRISDTKTIEFAFSHSDDLPIKVQNALLKCNRDKLTGDAAKLVQIFTDYINAETTCCRIEDVKLASLLRSEECHSLSLQIAKDAKFSGTSKDLKLFRSSRHMFLVLIVLLYRLGMALKSQKVANERRLQTFLRYKGSLDHVLTGEYESNTYIYEIEMTTIVRGMLYVINGRDCEDALAKLVQENLKPRWARR